MNAWRWVDNGAELAAGVGRWLRAGRAGVDTEFVRVSTFFPRPGLYQVAGEFGCDLVDPLVLANWRPFGDFLVDATVVKVMHACGEDVELLAHHVGVRPWPVFDTQVAAALLGPEMAVSYRALVEAEFGVGISKAETRSDWLRRPLSERQLRYAAADAAHLVPLHDVLAERLARAGRRAWHDDEVHRLVAGAGPAPVDTLHASIAGAGRLDRRGLAALRALCRFREEAARRLDRPRNHVIPEPLLLPLAEAAPATLAGVERLLPGCTAHAEGVLAALAAVTSLPDAALPPPLPAPLSGGERSHLERLREQVEQVARRLGVAPGFLASKRALQSLVLWQRDRSGAPPAYFAGWRRDVLAAQVDGS